MDVELGLVRVVEIATDAGRGQGDEPARRSRGSSEGGIAQGLGLALMEEIQLSDGPASQRVLHRLPDPDDPRHAAGARRILELPQPEAPYGLNGIAEAPTIASTPAIVAAIRAASGRALTRVPVRPDDVVGLG